MESGDLWRLSAAQAVELLRAGKIESEELVAACLERVAAVEPDVQAWTFLDPEHALGQAREADAWRRAGRPLGRPARGAGRAQGHHRYGRHAHRERIGAARRPDAVARRRGHRDAAGRGGGHHGQDGHHRVRHPHAGQDAQPARSGPHPRGLVERLRRGGGRGHGPARPRQPDRRLHDPAGVVLRGVRAQADPRSGLAARHVPPLAEPRPRGALRPRRGGSRPPARGAGRPRRARSGHASARAGALPIGGARGAARRAALRLLPHRALEPGGGRTPRPPSAGWSRGWARRWRSSSCRSTPRSGPSGTGW